MKKGFQNRLRPMGWILFFTGIILTPGTPGFSPSAHAQTSLPFFSEPQAKDWKHFHSLPVKGKESLWQAVTSQGKHLQDLSWQWRLGFIQSCTEAARGRYCKDVLLAGLTDRAMVVRAAAASGLGRIYENSSNEKITTEVIKALQAAYHNPRNLRNGKPLIVQERILFALKEIGGESSMSVAKDLASKHQKTSSYWQKVSKW